MSTEKTPVAIKLLSRFQPLETLSESHLKEVSAHAELSKYPQGKMLFKRNQPCKHYHYLVSGSVDVLDAKYQVTPLRASDDHAVRPLDTNDPYQLSAVTTSAVEILRVSKDHLDLVLTWNQAGNYLVEELGAEDETTLHLENDWMSCLLGSSLFQQIPPSNLQQLFVKFSEMPVKKGVDIIHEGDKGETFYVIKQGSVVVSRKDESGKTVKLAALGPGQYFGEEALISDNVRNATVVMEHSGTLMKLGKDDFKTLLEQPVVQHISYKSLDEMRSAGKNVQFLDVRLDVEIPPEERADRLIIPLPELRGRLSQLDTDSCYVLYPEGGRRATLGNYLLNEAGLNAFVLEQPH